MKIGYVIDDTLDSTDGVQQYVLTISRWMQRQGHEVYYLAGESHRTDLPHLYSLSKNRKVSFNGNALSVPLPVPRAQLRHVLSEVQLDVLHVQTPYSPFMGGRLVALASPKTAVVGTFHILPYSGVERAANRALGLINHSTARRFDVMMAVSAPAQNFAKHLYGFESEVVGNPFLYHHFADSGSGLARSESQRIVFLGRLVARKGAYELLKAVAYLKRQRITNVPFQVVIAGRGGELARLQEFARNNGLEGMIAFPGFIAEEHKAALLADSDIAVFPSISGESFGISLLEAMAASRGVVLGGNNPGYASVVATEEQLIEPTNTHAFAMKLAYWLEHDEERAQASHLQRQHVAQYDIEVIGPKVEKIYEAALQKRRTP